MSKLWPGLARASAVCGATRDRSVWWPVGDRCLAAAELGDQGQEVGADDGAPSSELGAVPSGQPQTGHRSGHLGHDFWRGTRPVTLS